MPDIFKWNLIAQSLENIHTKLYPIPHIWHILLSVINLNCIPSLTAKFPSVSMLTTLLILTYIYSLVIIKAVNLMKKLKIILRFTKYHKLNLHRYSKCVCLLCFPKLSFCHSVWQIIPTDKCCCSKVWPETCHAMSCS